MAQNIDLKVRNIGGGLYDIDIDPDTGDFALTQGMDTSLIMSLFEERRADPTQIIPPENRRGWWGNVLFDEFAINNFQIGSLLWLLHQARLTQETLNNAIDFCRQSLQWLIDDGHADAVEVDGQITDKTIILNIDIFRDGDRVESKSFDIWEATELRNEQVN